MEIEFGLDGDVMHGRTPRLTPFAPYGRCVTRRHHRLDATAD